MSSEWKKKALESEDPDVIKTGRTTAKRMFTMDDGSQYDQDRKF